MNSIAMQIDYTADILKATNDLLEARSAHRSAQNNGSSIHVVIDAQVKVLKAEMNLRDLIDPSPYESLAHTEPLPDCGETKDEHADYYGRQPRMTADERTDDPRRGQGALK